MTNTIETMLAHRSVRKFADEIIEREVIEEAVRAAQQASTSSNIQAYSCLWVRDSGKRKSLAGLCGGQAQVEEAGAFLVICGDQRRHRVIAERAEKPFHANMETFVLAAVDAALFAQSLALAFESLGYGICFIGGLRLALPEVDRLLDVPSGVLPFYGLCVGRAAHNPGQRPRLSLDAILCEERFPSREELDDQIDRYDEVMRDYYEERANPGHDWSGGISRKFEAARRPDLASYYRSKGAAFE